MASAVSVSFVMVSACLYSYSCMLMTAAMHHVCVLSSYELHRLGLGVVDVLVALKESPDRLEILLLDLLDPLH